MKKKTYNKLVRDNVVRIIEKSGRHTTYSVLGNDEYVEALNQKLLEEANEYAQEGDIEELADVFEVLFAIVKAKNLSMNRVEDIRINKRAEKGAFDDRIFLREVMDK